MTAKTFNQVGLFKLSPDQKFLVNVRISNELHLVETGYSPKCPSVEVIIQDVTGCQPEQLKVIPSDAEPALLQLSAAGLSHRRIANRLNQQRFHLDRVGRWSPTLIKQTLDCLS